MAAKRAALMVVGCVVVSCAAPAVAPPRAAAPSFVASNPPEVMTHEAREKIVHEEEKVLVKPAPRPGAYANTDPNDDFDLGPPEAMSACEDELERAKVKWAAAKIPVHTEKASLGAKLGTTPFTCGAPQVIMYLGSPAKIAYEPPPILTCKMALALASWEKIIAEEAERSLGSRVVKIEQLGTYNCRVIPTAPYLMSEHGYANAIDIGHIYLANGRNIDIYRDFDKGDGEPKTKNGAFLRAISRRANDEDVFSHVLTPFFDAAHNNHFHLDLARFRRDGTRPSSLRSD